MLFSINKDPANHTDAELVLKFQASGNNKFIGELFERYSRLVYGLCLKYFKNEMESKDAVISIFEKLMNDLHKHNVNNFKSWLYMVAKNYCLMQLREQKALQKKDAVLKVYEESGAEDHTGSAFEGTTTDKKETELQALEAAIQELKPEQRACVELFYLQEKCYQEVADITGYELKKVKSHIQNGKRNLKITLTAEYGSIFA